MTDLEIAQHVAGVEKQLPESAISARLALSLVFGHIAAQQTEIERLRAELERRPRMVLLQGGAL